MLPEVLLCTVFCLYCYVISEGLNAFSAAQTSVLTEVTASRMKPVDDIIFIAKGNHSPASQVGHIARYIMKLGEGYILIYYYCFI